jgi:hypothetical protein
LNFGLLLYRQLYRRLIDLGIPHLGDMEEIFVVFGGSKKGWLKKGDFEQNRDSEGDHCLKLDGSLWDGLTLWCQNL